MMKVCNKCGQKLSINNFAKKKYRSGNIGRAGTCKGCENARRRAKYKPVIRENDKLYEEGKRRCMKCSVIKPLSDYGRYTARKGGIKSICKECDNIRRRDWKRKNADRINEGRRERHANDTEYREKTLEYKRKYRTNNRERYLKLSREGSKRRYWENPDLREKLCKAAKNYRENRTDEQIQRDRENRYQYIQDNREKITIYKREWTKNKLETDPIYKIKVGLAKRFRQALKRYLNGKPIGVRGDSAVELLGCSLPEFMEYMEEQFYNNPETSEKMTWDNWKADGWHIDHIKPLSKFNLNDPKQVEKAVHYTNLQPLWWRENLEKGAKYEDLT